jgi:F-type H+-transporting ATPase subunit b
MLCVFAIMLWADVPKIIAGMLDQRIAGIRRQLDEAAKLRAEAQALRDDYAKKAKQADAEIAVLKQSAERQAEEIVAKAKADATNLIARHQRLAEDKIAAAERAAVEDLRAKVALAAAEASRQLIAEKHDAAADKKLVDQAISSI